LKPWRLKPSGWSPNQLVTAMGVIPSASRSSCPVKPALTTRLGGLAMVVSPKACEIVTGPLPPPPVAAGGALSDEQPARASRLAAAPALSNPRRVHCWSTA